MAWERTCIGTSRHNIDSPNRKAEMKQREEKESTETEGGGMVYVCVLKGL